MTFVNYAHDAAILWIKFELVQFLLLSITDAESPYSTKATW